MSEEKFVFTGKAKQKLLTILGVGVVLLIIGIIGLSNDWSVFDPAAHEANVHHSEIYSAPDLTASAEGGHHSDGHHAAEAHASEHSHAAHAEGHGYHWIKRVYADLWHNNLFFMGISIAVVFFLALNYVTWAGWSAILKRVFEAFGYYIPIAGVLTLVIFSIANHDLFHWTHDYLYDVNDSRYDAIIAGKENWLNMPFYYARMITYFVLWSVLFSAIRKESQLEDLNGGTKHHNRMIVFSGIFIVVFGVTTSTAAWDFIMSIDTHWFSTLFGWYVFASWFVSGIAAIVLVTVMLKENGYLKQVNAEHLHDLGKFMFAFSIFWTYLWFSQFLLIWYANIPEESIYFIERLFNNMGVYMPIFIMNLIVCFAFPFLFFMTRDSKRVMTLLKVGAIAILFGHWFDFYLMIMPGVLNEHGGFNIGNLFVELGIFLMFLSLFAGVVMYGLSKANLIAKNHPMLDESINHHT